MNPPYIDAAGRPADAVNPDGLRRVVALVVDDNLKTRALLSSILNSIGIGKVLRAFSGANALELIHEMRRRPERVGVSAVDLIISEWKMAQVDGAALLRWVRSHRESPDHFLPFIAISAAPLESQVQAARDLGANQFIARPYSVNILRDHIESLVHDGRNFIKSRDYFGPDRRFHDLPVEVNRRAEGQAERAGVRYLVPPRRLAAKVGGQLEIEPAALAEAENELEAWHDEFMVTVEAYLEDMASEFAKIRSTVDPEARHRGLDNLNRISRKLRDHGHSFGFPLVTTVSRSLHQLTRQTDAIEDDCLELVCAHLDTMRAVLVAELRSDGGKVGRELVQELQRANRSFVRSSPHRQLAGAG